MAAIRQYSETATKEKLQEMLARLQPLTPEEIAENKRYAKWLARGIRYKIRMQKPYKLNVEWDPEIFLVGLDLAGHYLERGVHKFVAVSKAIAEDLEMELKQISKYLPTWYNIARDYLEDSGVSIEGMDGPDTVKADLKRMLAGEFDNDTQGNGGRGADGDRHDDTGGMDPEAIGLGIKLAVFYIESGLRKFPAFARQMVADIGDGVKPYLKAFYTAAREMPEAEAFESEMDEYSAVNVMDIEAVLKEQDDGNHNIKAQEKEKLNSGSTCDYLMYQKIRPHLQTAWIAAKLTYGEGREAVIEFIKKLIEAIGADVQPYARKFYAEILDGTAEGALEVPEPGSVRADSEDTDGIEIIRKQIAEMNARRRQETPEGKASLDARAASLAQKMCNNIKAQETDKLNSGIFFDDKIYMQIRPHMLADLNKFNKAGKSLKEYVEFLYDKFAKHIPSFSEYLAYFIGEIRGQNDYTKEQGNDTQRNGVTGQGPLETSKEKAERKARVDRLAEEMCAIIRAQNPDAVQASVDTQENKLFGKKEERRPFPATALPTMTVEDIAAMAIDHWQSVNPKLCKKMAKRGQLYTEAKAAAKLTLAEMETWMLGGSTEDEAWEASQDLFIFTDPATGYREEQTILPSEA